MNTNKRKAALAPSKSAERFVPVFKIIIDAIDELIAVMPTKRPDARAELLEEIGFVFRQWDGHAVFRADFTRICHCVFGKRVSKEQEGEVVDIVLQMCADVCETLDVPALIVKINASELLRVQRNHNGHTVMSLRDFDWKAENALDLALAEVA